MKTTVNQRFKILREKIAFTQLEFSRVVDVSTTLISKIENGDLAPTEKAINKVCAKLNVSNEWLINDKGELFKSGTLQENIDRNMGLLKNNEIGVNPWENALVMELKEEVTYLRELLKMAVGGKGATANFNKALEQAGVPSYMLNIGGTHSGAELAN